MLTSQTNNARSANRRSFLRKGALGAGAVVGISLLPNQAAAFDDGDNSPLNKGDVAILTFLSALEQVEGYRCENSRIRHRRSSAQMPASDRQPKQLVDKLQLREWVTFAHPSGSPLPNHVDRLDSL